MVPPHSEHLYFISLRLHFYMYDSFRVITPDQYRLLPTPA
jgi:hypothetical protein